MSGRRLALVPFAADLEAELLPFGPQVIRDPEQMVRLLRAASPGGARRFAVAMHERVCTGCDQGWIDFWHRVVAALADDTPDEPSRGARQDAETRHDR